ncbi:hypothetical protein LJC31_00420 [Synergistaceae bacterium OttesenSCG-928-I11]|nr:hypothetical protein [Synergistaceae bacterium OttesenSCG-928-I11]
MKKIKWIALLFLVIALSTFVYLKTSQRHEPSPRDFSWDTAEKNVYLIQSSGSTTISMEGETGMKLDQTFLSRMAMRVVSTDEHSVYAVVRFIEPEYRVLGMPLPLGIPTDSNAVLHFGRGGEILHIYFPANFGENETNLLRQIFLTMETHLAPAGEKWEWRSSHDSSTADYRFHISGRTLARKTLLYENRDAESVRVLSSDFSCEISPICWIDNVYAYEEKSMKMGFAESNGYLKLEMKRISPMPTDTALWNETGDLKTIFAKMREPNRTTARTEQRMLTTHTGTAETPDTARMAPEEIDRYLREILPTLSIQDTDGVDAYIQFLMEHPEAVGMLPAWLLENGDLISDSQHSIFMFALERCGSTEAQAALMTIATGTAHSEIDSARAIVALAGVDYIEDKSIRFLQALSRKDATDRDRMLANTAILNLGAAADILRTSDPFAYRDLVSDIRKDLHDSQGDTARSALILGSLGNIRDSSLFPDIAPYAESGESTLRAAAYDALRFMQGEEPEKLIRHAIASEQNGEARFALSGALSYREPDRETVKIAMDSIESERDSFVINDMLGYICRDADEDGSVKAFLRASLRNKSIPVDSRRNIINELRKRGD